jgi:COP9 signalosome complex subunit 1
MGNEDLGNHYFAIGECGKAGQYYTKMREFCTTPKHIAEMTLKLLYVTITQKSWTTANSYRLKMSGMGFREEERTNKYDPLLNACEGLIRLSSGSYREAAEAFLSVDPSYMTLEPQAGISFQRRVISPNDVAIYGGICALATMDSAELKSKVLENQPFRQYLELESHLRRAISMFCSSKFTGCLGVLDSYTADYKLDVYLQPHLERLYHMIRSKSLVQWFSAFSVVSLDEVTRAFPSLEGNVIVEELEDMIKSGTLDARIDLVDNVSFEMFPPRLAILTIEASTVAESRSPPHRTRRDASHGKGSGTSTSTSPAPNQFAFSGLGS